MKKFAPIFLAVFMIAGISVAEPVRAESLTVKVGMLGKKKKYKGYKKPRSKKILGIFKRKTDCGCPNH